MSMLNSLNNIHGAIVQIGQFDSISYIVSIEAKTMAIHNSIANFCANVTILLFLSSHPGHDHVYLKGFSAILLLSITFAGWSVKDHRFSMLSVDSQYCNLEDLGAAVETLGAAQYCALHLHIHSLPSKIIQLREIVFSLKEQGITIHFILLCEIFLTNANAHLFPIAGYNCVHKRRSQLTSGGVAIYMLDGFN